MTLFVDAVSGVGVPLEMVCDVGAGGLLQWAP